MKYVITNEVIYFESDDGVVLYSECVVSVVFVVVVVVIVFDIDMVVLFLLMVMCW